MPINLKGRSFVKELDYDPEEIKFLLKLAADLKAAKYGGYERPRLTGKNIALIFEKASTRTRSAFEVAAYDQGAHTTYLGPDGTQIGKKESMKDTARVLGRMYDAIEYRGKKQSTVQELAQYAGVPVYNGLTDEFHPTQMLADVLTMLEHANKPLSDISFAYLGDGRFNMGNSYLLTGALLGMDVRIGAPADLMPQAQLIETARTLGDRYGARITLTQDVAEAVRSTDFIITDVWVSMGEPPAIWGERIEQLHEYQVNARVMALSGNPNVKFMHCLPAFHNRETEMGEDVYQQFHVEAMEVTEEVFESPASVVFDEAENRMHTVKALMVATLG